MIGLGSPPRVRERQRVHRYINVSLGITPACAGKTFLVRLRTHTDWDHPRVCGKDSTLF